METPATDRDNNGVAWNPNAPSYFNIPSSWNWNSALSAAGLTPAQIALVHEPQWAVNGKFPNGVEAMAGTPAYPGRSLQQYHWNNWAPRIGAAYRLNDKTTLRLGSDVMYISTTGNYNAYWPTVPPTTSGGGATDCMAAGTGIPCYSWNHMFRPEDMNYFNHTMKQINYLVSGNDAGPLYSVNLNMPRDIPVELDGAAAADQQLAG